MKPVRGPHAESRSAGRTWDALPGEKSLAHLSDLHLGHGPRLDDSCLRLSEALRQADVDHVVVTGDVTHRGRKEDAERFWRVFAAWRREGRLSVVPGNHDRLGEDVREQLMTGPRVQAAMHDGLLVVRVDSTGPHNRRLLAGHGALGEEALDAIDEALGRAPAGALRVVALHHHPLPLPEEDLFEHLCRWLRRPNAAELSLGRRLVERLRGRCDLLLHGHRHVPAERVLFRDEPAPLRIYNAGCTPRLERFRLFRHREGALAVEPTWVSFGRQRGQPPVTDDLGPALPDGGLASA